MWTAFGDDPPPVARAQSTKRLIVVGGCVLLVIAVGAVMSYKTLAKYDDGIRTRHEKASAEEASRLADRARLAPAPQQ